MGIPQRSSYTLIRGARQLLTLRGPAGARRGATLRNLGILENGTVLIKDGIIEEVGPARRIEKLSAAREAREIDATGRVVAPGFVDSHSHLVCGPPRLADYEMRLDGASYGAITTAGGGIMLSVRAIRELPASTLQGQAERALEGFARHGVTTLEAKSGYGLDETAERKSLCIVRDLNGKLLDLIPTYLGAHVVPPEYDGRADEYIEWMIQTTMHEFRQHELAHFADIYCDTGAFTIEQSRRYLLAAREHGFLLKIHAEQFSHTGATQLAVELGAVSADHCDCVNEDDVHALAGSDTIATLLPGAVFHLGLPKYAPARALIEGGAAVALATDFNPGSSPTWSMPMILSLACTQMRMTPAEAFSAATINGAHALRRADRYGSIEPKKSADLVIFDVPDYREIPYHFGVNPVTMTIKRGSVIYDRTARAECREH